MSLKTALFLLAALWGVVWYVQAGIKAREADAEKEFQYEQQLAISEVSQDVIRSSLEITYKEIMEKMAIADYGITILENSEETDSLESSVSVIIPRNSSHIISCDHWLHDGRITVSFDSARFYLEKYTENLPFLPKSVAGKKLTHIVCDQVAVWLHNTLHKQTDHARGNQP